MSEDYDDQDYLHEVSQQKAIRRQDLFLNSLALEFMAAGLTEATIAFLGGCTGIPSTTNY